MLTGLSSYSGNTVRSTKLFWLFSVNLTMQLKLQIDTLLSIREGFYFLDTKEYEARDD